MVSAISASSSSIPALQSGNPLRWLKVAFFTALSALYHFFTFCRPPLKVDSGVKLSEAQETLRSKVSQRERLPSSIFTELIPDDRLSTQYCGGEVRDVPSIHHGLKALPVGVGDHMVSFLIDADQKRIEYFDARGLTILDRKNETILTTGQTLYDVCLSIFKKYPAFSIKENTQLMQWNRYNCVVYTDNYLIRRLSGETWEDIQNHPGDDDAMRQEMIHQLESNNDPRLHEMPQPLPNG